MVVSSAEDEVHRKQKGAAGSQDEDSNRRLQYLERSMEMLKKQHCEILQSLHQEIDDLKRQNKDLNFKIIMSQKDSRSSLACDVSGTEGDGGNDDKTVLTEEQRRGTEERTDDGDDKHGDDDVNDDNDGQQRLSVLSVDRQEGEDVKDVIVGERSDLSDLSHLGDLVEGNKLSDLTDAALSQEGGIQETQNRELKMDKGAPGHTSHINKILTIESLRFQLAQFGANFHNDVKFTGHHSAMHPYITTNSHMNQHMSILELQNMIKDLQEVNDSQSHELQALKSDLRDVLYSHKWTPDAYLIAKAYIAFDDAKAAQKDRSKPLRSTPKLLSKKELEERGAASVADNLTLPPLKQTVGNAAVERRKRTRTLQKRRLKDREMMF
ncbi:coiled-coil domain-containing protein 74B [Octopus bimaculoides]|uniref:coiled-coil domain-containing protein 74B n=1 Tax=Octopus bimaculoides TaxID=37653 RepID=UPI00071D6262|nr:coiled-coil domain-containing protein 74B [Octopus bimaculoides]|eukprot:XP_014790903.1 PREDICTED: coiled-coil domain-containing protein 74B-like [Octopus bimaculoides]